tara:strand:+ start:3191 stop:3619 length:429 start_codon:yes stop_codon:yes gene_type:complete
MEKSKYLILFLLICIINFLPLNFINSYAYSSNLNIKNNCSTKASCVEDFWKLDNVDLGFSQLIDILENTPRVKIIEINDSYLHALSISRIFKFKDDIEVRKIKDSNKLQVRSQSRIGLYDFGVNKRRVETLRFRLIDIYKIS